MFVIFYRKCLFHWKFRCSVTKVSGSATTIFELWQPEIFNKIEVSYFICMFFIVGESPFHDYTGRFLIKVFNNMDQD